MYKKIFLSYKRNIRNAIIGFFVVVVVFVLFLFYWMNLSTPSEISKMITIPEGYSITQIGELLENENIIRSKHLFRIKTQLDNVSLKAGTYLFDKPHTLSQVLERLRMAQYGDVYTKVTIPEGSTIAQITDILDESLENFNSEEFIQLTEGKEGYLFPDTYSFLQDVKTEVIVDKLLNTFNEKTRLLKQNLSSRSWEDIVIMASIIEKEAGKDPDEQKMVAGILWKRIDQGIPMQVDAPFVYSRGLGSSQLRTTDLRTDGPYNTYTRKGLTPTPIGNPGLSALDAAMNPTESL